LVKGNKNSPKWEKTSPNGKKILLMSNVENYLSIIYILLLFIVNLFLQSRFKIDIFVMALIINYLTIYY